VFYLEEEITFYYPPGIYDIDYELKSSTNSLTDLFYSDDYFTKKELISFFEEKEPEFDTNIERVSIKGNKPQAYRERPKINKRSF